MLPRGEKLNVLSELSDNTSEILDDEFFSSERLNVVSSLQPGLSGVIASDASLESSVVMLISHGSISLTA